MPLRERYIGRRRLRGAAALLVGILSGAAGNASAPHRLTDVDLLDRVTWGANPSAAAALSHQGQQKWLAAQLTMPADTPLPPPAQALLTVIGSAHPPMAALAMSLDAQIKAANQIADMPARLAARDAYQKMLAELGRDAARRSLLRDLYSPAQLRETMTWFWVNQFNVHARKSDIRALIGDYEDQAIRPRALGRFRDLLEATLRHPAMLRYLDNAQNAAGRINENYAREIMELHTMGVGSGYSQKDVQELARILTGVGLNLTADTPRLKPAWEPLYIRDGLFEFNPARHDFGDKIFLGHVIKGSGYGEVDQALDLIVAAPATAHHVASRLALYFVGDAPPPALVDRMAAVFHRSGGDIAAMLRLLFRAPEFRESAGTAFKDPIHYAVSAVRLAYDDRVIRNPAPLIGWIARLGEGLYDHETPDGYPLSAAAWSGPGQMAARFEIAHAIGNGSPALFTPPVAMPGTIPVSASVAAPGSDAIAQAPTTAPEPALPQLQTRYFAETIGPRLGPATRNALTQAKSPQEWNMLFLSSPEFMRR